MKIKNLVQEAKENVRKAINTQALKAKFQQVPIRKILCNSRGGAGPLDIALDVVIGVVMAAIVLIAMKSLFNVNILPSVTDKITGLFS